LNDRLAVLIVFCEAGRRQLTQEIPPQSNVTINEPVSNERDADTILRIMNKVLDAMLYVEETREALEQDSGGKAPDREREERQRGNPLSTLVPIGAGLLGTAARGVASAARAKERILSGLTRSQKRNVETLNNVIENNLTEHDFSGTLKDLQGNPISKSDGTFWDHKTEMIYSYRALQKVKKSLKGSLKNPNLEYFERKFLIDELNRVRLYMHRIEELFRPFGGVR